MLQQTILHCGQSVHKTANPLNYFGYIMYSVVSFMSSPSNVLADYWTFLICSLVGYYMGRSPFKKKNLYFFT